MKIDKIKIIDLFAGPGGLGEGFSSYLYENNQPFQIALSIEKDSVAHQTLELRSFFRQFNKVPDEYYSYLKREISKKELYDKFKYESDHAINEALCLELGKDNHEDIDKKIKKSIGDNKNWLLIGGPPCQAYSLAGRSRRTNDIEFENDHKHFLYKEYLRIIAHHKPAVFVMENVKGLLSSKLDSERIFPQILNDLKRPTSYVENSSLKQANYNIYSLVKSIGDVDFKDSDYVIKAEEYGIPQTRHRVILVGVRSDFKIVPDIIQKKERFVSVRESISDLPRIASGVSNREKTTASWSDSIIKIKKYSFWAKENKKIKEVIESQLQEFNELNLNSSDFIELEKKHEMSDFVKKNLYDKKLKGVINHSSRSHIIKDLHRYLYLSSMASIENKSPVMKNLPIELLPYHKNVEAAVAGEKFADRFRVQIWDKPSTTITSHIAKDGHYFIHPDPAQCRSLTVREAARLQTFPDNYFFEGPRTEQYKQVGNAVPPLLARQIAEVIHKIFLKIQND